MIVYRFEKNGIGPYVNREPMRIGSFYRTKTVTRTEQKAKEIFERQFLSSDIDRHEVWVKAHSDKRYIYGSKSKEQLRAYFGGNFKQLFQRGYRIKRYRVPDHEVLDIVAEVAFPVKYHKLQSLNGIKKRKDLLS